MEEGLNLELVEVGVSGLREELGARSQTQKEFSLFEKQAAQWLERGLGAMSER